MMSLQLSGSILVTFNPPVPLNPVSIFVSWTPLSSISTVTGYRVMARSRLPPASVLGPNQNYVADVDGSDASNYTFTNLSPHTYDQAVPGVVYSISVSVIVTGDQVLEPTLEVNATIPRELTISFTLTIVFHKYYYRNGVYSSI